MPSERRDTCNEASVVIEQPASHTTDSPAGLHRATVPQLEELGRRDPPGPEPLASQASAASTTRWLGLLPRLVDAAVMALCAIAAYTLVVRWTTGRPLLDWPALSGPRLISATLVFLFTLLVFEAYGLYRRRIGRSFFDEFSSVLGAVTITVLLAGATYYFLHLPPPRLIFVTVWLLGLAAVPLGRIACRALLGALARRGIGVENVLIVGADEVGQAICAKLRRRKDLGLRVVGFLDSGPLPPTLPAELPVYHDLDAVREVVERHQVRYIILSFASHRSDELLWMVRTYDNLNLHFLVVPRLWEVTWPSYDMSHIEDVTILQLRSAAFTPRKRALKRMMDLALGGSALILLAPLFLLIALLVKLDSRGPVLYRSTRLGKDGKPFKMLKFRSMVVDADEQRAALISMNGSGRERRIFKLKGDPRVTRVGRWLRRLSLDELPQLINVLRGEMSLVGPRPLPILEGEQCRDWERKRMNVLPGITGYWQIMGRSDLGFDEMMRLDYLYLQNWSLAEDLRILVNTIGAVLAQRGAY